MRAKPNTRNGRNVKTNSGNGNNNNAGKFSVKKSLKENVSTSNRPDNSVLRPSVETSVSGLKQAVKLFETGTPEVLHLMTFECDVIYECRVCRNLFRSLANFISHKRVYCTTRFNHVQASPVVEDHTILVEEQRVQNGPGLPSRITARQDLTAIVQTSASQYYKEIEDKLVSRDINRCDATVHLQPIENTTYGVYQTVGKKDGDKLIKNQVSELHQIISTNEEAVLGPDGKIIQKGAANDQSLPDQHIVDDLICSLCKIKFSSKKTLSHHTKTVHESFRVCYSCPCCKNLFSNTWSVHRHLYKVHRKSSEQVRRLRSQIQKKQVRAEKLAEKFNRKSDNSKSKKEDNKAWMEHFEDDTELQRCGGCGRRFERKAALTSHAQICHKRIAACSSMQTAKRKEERTSESNNDAVPVKQQSTQGSMVQKVQSEKRIGIQVRMNYCKNSVGNTGMETRRSERHKSCEEKDEDIMEAHSADSILKERLTCQSPESINKVRFDSIQNAEEKLILCNSNVVEPSSLNASKKADSLSSSCSSSCGGSSCSARDNKIKMKRLENMCSQLRKAVGLEVDNVISCDPNSVLNVTENFNKNSDVGKRNSKSVSNIKSKVNKSKMPDKEVTDVNDQESRFKTDNHDLLLVSREESVVNSSQECGEERFKCDFVRVKDNDQSEEFRSELNEKSDCMAVLSSSNQEIIGEIELLKTNKKIVSEKNVTENENSIDASDIIMKTEDGNSNNITDASDKELVKDTVGILTRYKVRSIFKSDHSGLDVSSDISDQEELSNIDESSLKENLNDTQGDDQQSHWIYKKMSEYIRYKNKQCMICLKKFKMINHIRQHIADHLGWNNYHCLFSNCTYATFSRSDCIKHLMKTHLKSHEKHRALSLVGEIGQIKSDNCDIDLKCDLKNVSNTKRKKSDSQEYCVKETALKESIDSEFKLGGKDSVTVISVNDDLSEVILAEEFVHNSKMDSSCSELSSDIEPRIRKRFKRRKISGYNKHIPPVVRKCSPDSTTELMEKDLKPLAVGAQLEDDGAAPDVIVVTESVNDSKYFNQQNGHEHSKIADIPAKKNVNSDQSFNNEAIEWDAHGKGRDTEEEDEIQEVSMETNLDDGKLRRMVMEVIFGGQVSSKAENKQCSDV